MKLSIISDEISQDLEEIIQFANNQGLEYLELRSINDTNVCHLNPDQAATLADRLRDENIQVSCIASPLLKCPLPSDNVSFSQNMRDYSTSYEENLGMVNKVFQISDIFDCDNIRIFSFLKHDQSYQQSKHLILDQLKKLTEEAASQDKQLLLENEHSCFLNEIQKIQQVLEKINSSHLKLLLDPGNFYREHQRLPTFDTNLFDRLGYVHAKNIKKNCEKWSALPSGDIDYEKIIRTLQEQNYEGFISIETHTDNYLKEHSKINVEYLQSRL